MEDRDTLHRFEFDELPIRGEIVKLDATLREVTSRHEYPPTISNLLGELMVAASLLSATIKFEESLIIQLQGEGPVTLAVVDVSNQGTLRGLAHWSGDVDKPGLQDLIGSGRIVITVDPSSKTSRYQGIAPLEGESIAESIENYLARSEQLKTRLWVAVGHGVASGMLIQKLPTEEDIHLDEETSDTWERIEALGETIREDELLELPVVKILHRLFHQENVRLFEPEPVSFRCSCSRERVRGVLRALGHEEVMSILEEREKMGVNCEFCNLHYEFDRVDAEQVFATDITPDVPTTRH